MHKKYCLFLLSIVLFLASCGKKVDFPSFTKAPENEIPVYYHAHDFAHLAFPVYYFLKPDGKVAYRAYADGTFYEIALSATDRVMLDVTVEPTPVSKEEEYGTPERAAHAPNESRWERIVDGFYRIPVEEFFLYRAWGRIGNVTAFFPVTEKGDFLPGATPDVHTIGKRKVRLMAPGSKGVLLKTEEEEVRLATKIVNDEAQKIYKQELLKKHLEQDAIDRERQERWAKESDVNNFSGENGGTQNGNVTGGYENGGLEPPTSQYDPTMPIPIIPANNPVGIDHHLEGSGN